MFLCSPIIHFVITYWYGANTSNWIFIIHKKTTFFNLKKHPDNVLLMLFRAYYPIDMILKSTSFHTFRLIFSCNFLKLFCTMFLVPDDYVLMLPPPFPKRNTSSTVQTATLQKLNERIQFMYGSIKGLKTSKLRLIRL